MDKAKFELETPFLTDDPYFALGFEAGMIYERLKRSEPFVQVIHLKNVEQITAICERSGRSYEIEAIDDMWSQLAVYLRLFTN